MTNQVSSPPVLMGQSALACLLGFVVFIPYRIGDSQAETQSMLKNR